LKCRYGASLETEMLTRFHLEARLLVSQGFEVEMFVLLSI